MGGLGGVADREGWRECLVVGMLQGYRKLWDLGVEMWRDLYLRFGQAVQGHWTFKCRGFCGFWDRQFWAL